MMKEEMEQLVKDYHWMINSVKVIREGMNEVGEGMTARYGLEAAMPKAERRSSWRSDLPGI